MLVCVQVFSIVIEKKTVYALLAKFHLIFLPFTLQFAKVFKQGDHHRHIHNHCALACIHFSTDKKQRSLGVQVVRDHFFAVTGL